MPYELAKQLKDKGFPQDGEGWMLPLLPLYDDGINRPVQPDKVYAPTLEELIQACGNGTVIETHHYLDGATAMKKTSNGRETDWVGGETPTIAVAKLWLSLHNLINPD